MSMPRRRILRPPHSGAAGSSELLEKRRHQLDQERAGLARWLSRLKRAFHKVDRHHRRIRNLERQIERLLES
jgi:hypothetical protein